MVPQDIDIWREVVQLAKRQAVFSTLGSRCEEFTVVDVDQSCVKLQVGKAKRIIRESRADFELAWQVIQRERYLELQGMRENESFSSDRPAYIAAILAQLPFVERFQRGRRLALRLKPEARS